MIKLRGLKKLSLVLVSLMLLIQSAQAVSFSWVSSKLSGDATLHSTKNEVEAYGWNFRSYTYIDPAGRVCTVVFTDEKGGGAPDCEFPPEGFDYEAFIKRAK